MSLYMYIIAKSVVCHQMYRTISLINSITAPICKQYNKIQGKGNRFIRQMELKKNYYKKYM